MPEPTSRDTATASAAATTAAAAGAPAPAPTPSASVATATGPRNLFIVLVLAGVLLPSPVGPVVLVGAAVVALRNKMRPWIPAVLVAGAIALMSYTVLSAPATGG